MSRSILGVIIAGGASTRFGRPKALATVGTERIIDRVLRALRAAVPDVVLNANSSEIRAAVPLVGRGDAVVGAGALGGIYTGLLWAEERGCRGAIMVACDMPFVDGGLLRHIVHEAAAGADVVIPESGGPRGVEPLCAYYAVSCAPAVRRALERGDHRTIAFHAEVDVHAIPLADVRRFGEPAVLFMNVNSPADHALAEQLAGSRP